MSDGMGCAACGRFHLGDCYVNFDFKPKYADVYAHYEEKIYPCQACGHGNRFHAYRMEPISQDVVNACKAYAAAVKNSLPGSQERIDAQYALTGLIEKMDL